jgi:predicted nucleotide-binding protein (sugar kinase/HSP70/actin superfamily)
MSKNTIETQGRIFMGDFGSNNKKIIVPNNPIEEAAQSQREAKEVEEAAKKAQELAKQKQAEIQRKLQKLEQLPMGTRIIIRPYPNNPYTNLMSEGGILVPSDSMFKNPDTGEWDNHT